ncbi:hypothetical protein FACS1894187_10910 [Synergistales bacterium]|nr:hypothetical protein FACS1894187_10910 [Synergistales bacterium]
MKKVFISQPMRDKSSEQILRERDGALAKIEEPFELIDTFFKDFDGNKLEFLGRSISLGLAKADVAVFIGNWQEYDGCRCEHFIASQYKIPCVYF